MLADYDSSREDDFDQAAARQLAKKGSRIDPKVTINSQTYILSLFLMVNLSLSLLAEGVEEWGRRE